MSDSSFVSVDHDTGSEGKLLNELKVTELRSELEKRGCDKIGVKATLSERLADVRSVAHAHLSCLTPSLSCRRSWRRDMIRRSTCFF